jgi:hypothetical protein
VTIVPGVGHFYDHAKADTVWGQDLIYAFYADDKTAYRLFRLYEKQDEDDQDHDTNLQSRSSWSRIERLGDGSLEAMTLSSES